MYENFRTPQEYQGIELSDMPDDKLAEFIKLNQKALKKLMKQFGPPIFQHSRLL